VHAVAQDLSTLRTQLRSYFKEREDAIEACLLAIVCGQHVFMLGQPGTAKTQMIRSIMKALRGARFFEIALSRNRPLEAVIGPLDILHFRATGEYRYNRQGYATDVEFALFNEIGKMADDLGHDLLALTNERIIHEVRIDPVTGEKRSVWPAPLSTAFCDSNEMLTEGSDDAAALWDRLLVRVVVEYAVSDANFTAILKGGEPEIDVQIEWEALQDVILKVLPAIELPDHVLVALAKVRHDLAEEGVKPSTRRFRQSVDVLRAAAFLDGRDVVTEDDIASLRFTLRDTLDQIQTVDRICRSASNPFVGPLLEIRTSIHELQKELEGRHRKFVDDGRSDWESTEGSSLQMYGKEVTKKLEQVRTSLDLMLTEAKGRPIPGFKAISDLHHSFLVQNFVTALSQSPEAAEIMAQKDRRGLGDGGNV
jgi:MoxR-like ATPase